MGTFVEGSNLVGPDPGRVDHHSCPNLEGLGPFGYDAGAGHPPVGGMGERVDPGVIDRHRTVVEDGGAQNAKGEPGVIGPGVPVEEAGHQVVGPQGGEVGEGLFLGHLLMPAPDAHAAGQVVEPESRQVGTGHAAVDHPGAAEEGDEEGDGGDEMRSVLDEPLAFGQVLVDQPELALLQVADAAVDQLRRLGRGPRGEVVLLDQGGAQASAGSVEGDPGSGDPSSDDEDVEGLALGAAPAPARGRMSPGDPPARGNARGDGGRGRGAGGASHGERVERLMRSVPYF